MQAPCKFCGDPYEQRRSNHEFCSPDCRGRWNKIHRSLSEISLINQVIMYERKYDVHGGDPVNSFTLELNRSSTIRWNAIGPPCLGSSSTASKSTALNSSPRTLKRLKNLNSPVSV
jgi:hypothetical protein